MQTAAQRAKAAVEGAQHQVQDSLAELSQIQDKLTAVRAQHEKPDPAEIEALEARLQEIQLGMTTTVEQAGKEVQQVHTTADPFAQPKECAASSALQAAQTIDAAARKMQAKAFAVAVQATQEAKGKLGMQATRPPAAASVKPSPFDTPAAPGVSHQACMSHLLNLLAILFAQIC